MATDTPTSRTPRWSEFLNRRAGWVIGTALLLTALLAIPFLTMAPTENASQEPDGAVFDARDAIDERFVSNVFPVPFITAADDGNVLSRDGLLAVLAGTEAVRTDPTVGPGLFRYFDATTGSDVTGVLTIADLVDARLPGGLATATDAEAAAAVTEVIETYGVDSETLGLSVQARYDEAAGAWVSPAIFSQVLGDNDALGLGNLSITLGGDTDGEEWARSVVALLNADEAVEALGIAIDVNLTSEEQGQAAGPFIGFTILAVLAIVGLTFRSYWVLAVTGAALGALIVWLKGISNLIGLQDDLILSLVVPIAMISFGVDFVFHAVGRYREERAMGLAPRRSFVVGMASVVGALTLALASDAAAFLANVSAGIPSIIQFGVGAAIALVAAFLLLGIVAPLTVAAIEDRVGAPGQGAARAAGRVVASVLAGMTAMAAVLLMVYVMPAAGLVALVAYVLLFLALPVWRGRAGPEPHAAAAPTTGGSSRLVGSAIAGIAGARAVVLPLIAIVSIGAALLAVRVPTEFDVKDFFAADTDFVRSLDALDEHVGDRGGEAAQVYVAASLTDPDVVARIDRFAEEVGALDVPDLARSGDGAVLIEQGSTAVLDDLFASDVGLPTVAATTGVAMTDADGDRVPDTPQQLAAVWQYTRQAGIPFDAERLVRTPGDVRTAVWLAEDDSESATVFELALTNSREQASIERVRTALAPALDSLQTDLQTLDPDTVVELTGGPIVRQASLEAISRALQVSLPIAVLVCLAIAAVVMRSARLGVVAVVPILMTVAWLYAVMEIFGFAINIVTATIGAVSIGIGIDFAIHFTMRYRDELAASGSRATAVRIAGEGTGTALIASAVSSAIGFGILALAPMPLFASYGLLTAVMILMALSASLLVLPGLLMLVTTDARDPVGAAVGAAQPEPAVA